MSVVHDISINLISDVVIFVLIAVFSKLLYEAFIALKMSNVESLNNVIEDKTNTLPSDSLKSTFVKDASIIEGTKINILDIKRNKKEYEVSGKVFRETQFKMDDEKYLRFEIREDTTMATDDAASTSVDLRDHTESSTGTTPFSLGIQKVPNGVIINSNVYLSDRNYHTLVSLDDGRGLCGVCETVCKIEEYQDHISSEGHLKNLESHSPLCKYDLCIIRKLHENYHCGVCNLIFDIKNSNEHFASKCHEDKLLFAINRASDIMYDLDIHKDKIDKNDPYHFNAKAINNMNRVNDDDDDDECFNGFYDAYKPEHVSDYENCSTDECMSDIEEIPNPLSYASMAKKLQLTPKFVDAEIDGKKMDVRFNSWHMILSLKSNKYYCMVCKIDGHISLRTDHCASDEHLAKLKKCKIVKKYVGFLIRMVDRRLYHCAHCNNLQLLIDIEDHIKTKHPRRIIKNVTENNNIPTIIKAKNSHNSWTESDGNTEAKAKTVDDILADSIESKIKDLYIFCAKFTLPLLSYNMVLNSNGFHCCVCEISTDAEGISRHIHEVYHMENMNRCPFIFKYNNNLIRLIRIGYHCAICNVTVPYDSIDAHVTDENHVQMLSKTITFSPTTQLIIDPVENKPSTSKYTNSKPNNTRIAEEETEAINDMKHGNSRANVASIKNKNLNEELNTNKVDLCADATKSIRKQSIENETEEIRNDLISEISSIDTEDIKNDAIVESSSINTEDDDNDAIVESPLNPEDCVFLKRKNVFAKVTLTSYNTLVAIGDGNRYCALCSLTLEFNKLKKHLESRQHMDNIRKYKYLEKYEKHLLRQILHTYHCSVCNVMFSWRELNLHITWPVHRDQLDRCYKIVKNNRRTDMKNGMKQIPIELQKETLYTTYIEPKIKIGIYYEFSKNEQEISKKSKMVINNGTVLKISWDSWHGFSKSKNGLRCSLCQRDVKSYERSIHSNNGFHLQKLEENFLKEYSPALIRKINETTLNCVTCNTVVPNQGYIITDHIKGKKHEKNYDLLIKDSSECNTYADCTDDIFTLQ